jgi:hypothetical protein
LDVVDQAEAKKVLERATRRNGSLNVLRLYEMAVALCIDAHPDECWAVAQHLASSPCASRSLGRLDQALAERFHVIDVQSHAQCVAAARREIDGETVVIWIVGWRQADMHGSDLMLAAVGRVGPANQADFNH